MPAHAAVDAANRLAQADGKAVHFKSLINAVLRRVSREGEGVLAMQDAARLNTPDWLWPRWSDNMARRPRARSPTRICSRRRSILC